MKHYTIHQQNTDNILQSGTDFSCQSNGKKLFCPQRLTQAIRSYKTKPTSATSTFFTKSTDFTSNKQTALIKHIKK